MVRRPSRQEVQGFIAHNQVRPFQETPEPLQSERYFDKRYKTGRKLPYLSGCLGVDFWAFWILAQVSRSVTVRLNTSLSFEESV